MEQKQRGRWRELGLGFGGEDQADVNLAFGVGEFALDTVFGAAIAEHRCECGIGSFHHEYRNGKQDSPAETVCDRRHRVRCDDVAEFAQRRLDDMVVIPGVFVVVPKGLRHRTYNVEEELLIYDVFTPPMF